MAQSFRSPGKVVRRLKLTPLAARKIRNWPAFMANYALGRVPRRPYTFRDGAKLKIRVGVDHAPIVEVFLRAEYGDVPDGATVIDLGASTGVFAIYAARRARGVHVYAYEPLPAYAALLRENVRLNGLGTAISWFDVAVGGEESERELFTPGDGLYFPTLLAPANDSTPARLPVRCTTIAGILESNALSTVDILKMDIEGGEYEALYATPPELLRRVSAIRMEYHYIDAERRNVDALSRFLVEQGYRVVRPLPAAATNGILWAEKR